MSWSFECCECGNNDGNLFRFIDHKPYTSVKKLECLVCNKRLKHIDYGRTELDKEKKINE